MAGLPATMAMTIHVHNIDPVAIQIGPLAIHWYGLMYLVSFGLAWWLGRRRLQRGRLPVDTRAYDDLMFYGMLGVIIGGRLGYVFFYDFSAWLADPLSLLRVWQGGMSFHGGLLGVLAAMAWWSRRHRLHFFDTVDFIAPLVPVGLFFGRIGNFIGGELWGRTSDVPWAVVFPQAPEFAGMPVAQLQQLAAEGALAGMGRHPSQLYQAALEGLALFAMLWWFSSRPRPRFAVSGLFALLYGLFRIIVEFVREPDAHIGYLAGGWLTMGMVLSLPLVALGLWLLWRSRRAPVLATPQPSATVSGDGRGS